MYISENLKSLRKGKDYTQEDAADMLGVSAQSVSKWERGETMPDISLLPALANLYKVSVDALLGMDKINDRQTRDAVFATGHDHLRDGNIDAAVNAYSEALKIFPNDMGFMSDLAISLALSGDPEKLARAVVLCERVLSESPGDKVHHTTRAALCFIYLKAGEKEKAETAARSLPHIRESRETILSQIDNTPTINSIDSYLKFIAIGEGDQQDIIEIDFGMSMIPVCEEHDLHGKIGLLRDEIDARMTKKGFRILPQIRIRDNAALAPTRIRLRYYADFMLDKEYEDPVEAVADIIDSLRKIANGNRLQ